MPKGIYKHKSLSKKTKEKLSESLKGKKKPPRSEEHKRKISESHRGEKNPNFGKHHSEETIQKMSEAHKGKKLSEESKRKISKSHKGISSWIKIKHHSEEAKQKMSKAHKGYITWNKGKKGIYSEEARKKMSESHKGEKSYFWKGGISFEPYNKEWTKTLKKSIRERDGYTCRICWHYPAFECHHINYDKKNCNPENLVTLCNSCHTKTNHDREKWERFFMRGNLLK